MRLSPCQLWPFGHHRDVAAVGERDQWLPFLDHDGEVNVDHGLEAAAEFLGVQSADLADDGESLRVGSWSIDVVDGKPCVPAFQQGDAGSINILTV